MEITKGLNLRALEIFVTVVEKESMSKASQHLGMTQSSISQHITQQENLFSTVLFDRSIRPISLTPAGHVYYQHAQKVLETVTDMWGTLHNLDTAPLKKVRISVIDTLADTLIPELTQCVGELYPKGSVTITSGQTDDHREALINRKTDIIITMDPMDDIDKMERYPLYKEPFVLVTPQDKPIKFINNEIQASGLPFIRFTPKLPVSRLIEQHLRRLKIRPPYRYELDTTRSIMPMIAAGAGWTITTPTGLLESRHFLLGVSISPLPFTPLHRTISLVAREHELGDLPSQLAKKAIMHLHHTTKSLLTAALPDTIEDIMFYG
ncbi:LysR family transcriptional regulator [uncultured Kiloniella sp.]|uniref:LysR family transcriptional regulator n=1 Tax=uncultured Kiloniella sp. TaxID=1133091 RepID=UPI00261E0A12|nr:LysR family transcriptional regulator [uncultured Kiloniella sp.]